MDRCGRILAGRGIQLSVLRRGAATGRGERLTPMTHRMAPLVVTTGTAVSALGWGVDAHLQALREQRGGLRPNDFEPAVGGWIGRVDGVEDHRLPEPLAAYDCRNNRLAAIALAVDGFVDAVAAACATYGAGRI